MKSKDKLYAIVWICLTTMFIGFLFCIKSCNENKHKNIHEINKQMEICEDRIDREIYN